MGTWSARSCIIFFILAITSCQQTRKRETNGPDQQDSLAMQNTTKPLLVDYKSEVYKIVMGESYEISNKIIDWQWAPEEDVNNTIDSTGTDAFMYLGEPLINYNNIGWLPSLHIMTDRNLITSFTCSVLFELEINDSLAKDRFLSLLSKDIKQLQNTGIVNSLKLKGNYEIDRGNYVESFRLTGRGNESVYDKFSYTVKLRQDTAVNRVPSNGEPDKIYSGRGSD